MSAWWMEDPNREPPEWSPMVRCIRCGDVYPSNDMYLDYTTDEWACRNWPECQGSDADIRLVECDGVGEANRGGEPC